jgi:predicted dinucleotide-binding enzyme
VAVQNARRGVRVTTAIIGAGMLGSALESSSKRSPDPAVLFYVTDDDDAGEEVGRLIRTAGFAPVNAGKLDQSGRLEVGGDLHDLVVGSAEARSFTSAEPYRGSFDLIGTRGAIGSIGRS